MRLHKNVAKGPERVPKSSKIKKGTIYLGGGKTLWKTATGGQARGTWGLSPLVCMLKEALDHCASFSFVFCSVSSSTDLCS